MCIFSGPVEEVSKTKIFARCAGRDQFLVYAMHMSAKSDTAMILPIPVAAGGGDGVPGNEIKPQDDAVQFISLEGYPKFFDDLESGFPRSRNPDSFADAMRSKSVLTVHKVGSFDASFVPTVGDFDRLDARFRLPAAASRHAAYASYGFVVFKFRPGATDVHPMAFKFPSAADDIFFPTVHVHDGDHMHEQEEFDHALYAQWAKWKVATDDMTLDPASRFVDIERTQGIVIDEPVIRRRMKGLFANADVWLEKEVA